MRVAISRARFDTVRQAKLDRPQIAGQSASYLYARIKLAGRGSIESRDRNSQRDIVGERGSVCRPRSFFHFTQDVVIGYRYRYGRIMPPDQTLRLSGRYLFDPGEGERQNAAIDASRLAAARGFSP